MSRRTAIFGLGLPLLLVLVTMGWSGIWDPYELNAADLGRRVALQMFHAPLELPQGENRLPTLGDVGHMDLPTLAMGLAFKLFGLRAWAGRLPFALAGAATLAVVFAFVRRLAGERAAAFAAWTLVTMPLFFVQARTMMGDAFSMLGFAAAGTGLLLLVLDDALSSRDRAAWAGVAALGLVVGAWTRGGLFGLALPCLAVPLAVALLAGNGELELHRGRLFSLVACAGVGAFSLYAAVQAKLGAPEPGVSFWLGTARVIGARHPTFDVTVRELAHGLFPWSALAPLVLVRGATGPANAPLRERDLRISVSVLVVSAFALHAWAAPFLGSIPFVGTPLLAVSVGFALFDVDRRGHVSRAVPVAAALLLLVLALDLKRDPVRSLVPFGVPLATFPDAFRDGARPFFLATAIVVAPVFLLALFDGHERVTRPKLLDEMQDTVDTLADVWNGNLAFVAVMLEAMLVGFAGLVLAKRHLGLKVALTEGMGEGALAVMLHACWAVPLGLLAAFAVVSLARRATQAIASRPGTSRGVLAAGAFVVGGLVMSLGYHPALGRQISPKEALKVYGERKKAGEELGLLSVAGRGVRYYGDFDTTSFADTQLAFDWLVEGGQGGRRFLALRAEELPRLSSLYRGRASGVSEGVTPDHNLPLLHAEGYAFLATSALLPGETNRSPYVGIFRAEPPPIAHPTKANLENQLEALGWDLADERGNPVRAVVPGRTYKLSLHVRVLAPVVTQWKAFVHVDGYGKRWNGDHDVLDGKVPMNLWKPGDVVTDTLDLRLEPNFTPGSYSLYFGFFLGERRMQVRSGKHHENRVEGGLVEVR